MRIIALAIILVIMPLTLMAQPHKMAGELGIDLTNYKFVSDIKNSPQSYSIDRIRSAHFLGLSLNGPLGNSHFANYLSRVKLTGIYFDSKTDTANSNSYVNPKISSIIGQMTFLPDKPYPLKLYASKSDEYSLQYESSNRTDRQRLQPELSIVRSYRNERSSVGGMLQVTPSEKVKFVTELNKETSSSNRIYDFGEQLDIWVDFTDLGATLGDTAITAIISNDFDSASVVFIITYLDTLDLASDTIIIIDTLAPGMTTTKQLFIGLNKFEFQAQNFNKFSGFYTITENLMVTASFRDQAAPNDIDQKRNSFTTLVKLGGDGNLTSEAYFEKNTLEDMLLIQKTSLTNFSNELKYIHSREISSSMLTTYTKNVSEVDTLSAQTATAFTHQSAFNYIRRRGLSAVFMHSYGHNVSEVGSIILKNDMNLLSSKLSYPFRKYNYLIEQKNNVTLNSDNTGYTNNQYSTELINKAEFRFAGITSRPLSEIKYVLNKQENPFQQSREIETKFDLDNKYYSKFAGDIKIKTSYSYRNRWNDNSSDTKNRYIIDFMVIKKIGEAYRISLMSNQTWEDFGGWIDVGGKKEDVIKPIEYTATYKFDLQSTLSSNLTLGVSYMLISQETTSIKKYGASLIANIPQINLPIKSFLLYEERVLSGLAPQTQLSIETKTNYRIRQINFVLTHEYRRENQLFETYSVNELIGTIYRNFDVY